LGVSKVFYKYKGFGYCCFEIDYEDMGMTGDEVGGCFGCGEEEYADNWILELPESAQEDITFHDKAEVEYLLVPEDNPRIKLKCPSFSFKGRIRFYFCEDEPQWRDLVYQEDRKEKTITITADEIISKEKWEAYLKERGTDNNKLDSERGLTSSNNSKNKRELTQWLRETWEKENKPEGADFFNRLKKYVSKPDSPIAEHYTTSQSGAGIKVRKGNKSKTMTKKAIQNAVSNFKKESQ